MPTTLTFIGYQNFYLMTSLKAFVMNIETPPTLDWQWEFSASTKCVFYVPDDSVDAYKTATNWSKYASQFQPLSSLTQ